MFKVNKLLFFVLFVGSFVSNEFVEAGCFDDGVNFCRDNPLACGISCLTQGDCDSQKQQCQSELEQCGIDRRKMITREACDSEKSGMITQVACNSQKSEMITQDACNSQKSEMITQSACNDQKKWDDYPKYLRY